MTEIMKQENKLARGLIMTLVAFVLLTSVSIRVVAHQDPRNPDGPPQGQVQGNQGPVPDLRQLNLTPEQIQQIRLINAELRDQRQAAGQRLRLAHRALGEAMESPNPNEALIDQRSREVADAQADTMRLRVLSEFRILQVLTPEQRLRLREMRIQNQAMRRQQRLENNQRPRIFRRGDAFQRGKPGQKPGPAPNRLPPPQQQRPLP
jgi:Spy/CpxP family protein refolding chaperone